MSSTMPSTTKPPFMATVSFRTPRPVRGGNLPDYARPRPRDSPVCATATATARAAAEAAEAAPAAAAPAAEAAAEAAEPAAPATPAARRVPAAPAPAPARGERGEDDEEQHAQDEHEHPVGDPARTALVVAQLFPVPLELHALFRGDALRGGEHGRGDAGRGIAVPELGHGNVAQHARLPAVGQRALEPVAGLELERVLLHRHEQQQAVAAVLVADAPGVEDARLERRRVVGLARLHREHRELDARLLVQLVEEALQLRRALLADHAGVVVDVAVERRDRGESGRVLGARRVPGGAGCDRDHQRDEEGARGRTPVRHCTRKPSTALTRSSTWARNARYAARVGSTPGCLRSARSRCAPFNAFSSRPWISATRSMTRSRLGGGASPWSRIRARNSVWNPLASRASAACSCSGWPPPVRYSCISLRCLPRSSCSIWSLK